MSLPQSFSTTVECPPLVGSSSSVTVRLSSSMTPSNSRITSLTTIPEGFRVRSHTESGIFRTPTLSRRGSHRLSMPPSSPSFAHSISTQSFRNELRLRSKQGLLEDRLSLFSPSSPDIQDQQIRWWNVIPALRSWGDDEDAAQQVPLEQKSAFIQTRDAVVSVLKDLCNVAMPLAEDSLDLLDLSPIPGLQMIAKTLINIWKAVKQVEMNRLAFLRLTHSCAAILQSIHLEIAAASEDVEIELGRPIKELERAFRDIQALLERQLGVPWLKRYLARNECLRSISTCNESLLQALESFKMSVQIRILHVVTKNPLYNKSEGYMQSLIENSLDHWQKRQAPPLDSSAELSKIPTSGTSATDEKPVTVLRQLQLAQTEQDAKLDLEDLRQVMKNILHNGSDVDLINFLQIVRQDMPEAIKALQRTLDRESPLSILSSPSKDILDREFIESGIGALRRISAGVDTSLPNWTITKFEVQPDKQIGVGNFSQVYKGTWKGRMVAIKFLAKETPSELFVREMDVWKPLDHPNVLRLLGASSATGEPPWFFVSPFMKHGSLVQFLKRVAVQPDYDSQGLGTIAENLPISRSRSNLRHSYNRVLRAGDAYRMLQDIAQGMEYLHEQHILHGDLKAANVLLDDRGRCVISDFGQSEMRSEVYRITRKDQYLQGTFRWKAPELMDGHGVLSQATDVYAYGILCTEVLTMGEIPWPMDDDANVRFLVLIRNKRPAIPADYGSPMLHELVNLCWAREPEKRPLFSTVVERLQQLRESITGYHDPISSPKSLTSFRTDDIVLSPRLSSPLSPRLSWTPSILPDGFDSSEYISVPAAEIIDAMRMEETVPTSMLKMPEPVHYLPDETKSLIERPPVCASVNDQASEDDLAQSMDFGKAGGPATTAAMAMEMKNEMRYRLLLEHKHHYSLSLPLWTPSVVELGDIGYLSKPSGVFVSLFNAFRPSHKAGGPPQGMPSIAGYGSISRESIRKEKRNVAQKSLDAVAGLLSFRSRTEVAIARRQSFRLRAGHKCAHLYTENTEYQYIKKLDAPKAWFDANVDNIMTIYGKQHDISKEDLCLVIGALQAQHHALFVSHEHPHGQAHFNVFSVQKKGQPWGMFTMDTTVPADRGGPRYEEPSRELYQRVTSNKVSIIGEPQKAVLIARLRFRTDETGCTRH